MKRKLSAANPNAWDFDLEVDESHAVELRHPGELRARILWLDVS